ncbi:MAG TPA: ATP-binding cassette domain-containing protein [Chitinophagaceae bacterium]|nr:ATP-binding cassette domain-containing protein [Chitinophagaceae bacterium]
MGSVLKINLIEKSYGTVKALKGVSFEVPKGCVFGVLGPNGSGKTTLLGILLDVLKADNGDYHWENYSSATDARKHIGSLLETPNFYHYLSAYDNLEITANIKGRGLNDIDNVLKKVNLYERRHSKFNTFSLGMKQRLAIAGALLGSPDILVLDEPTNGLDPVGISEIRELIKQLSTEGITIIMASHLLDEVEKVCTDVAILKLGNLLTSGPVMDVLNDEDWIELNSSNNEALASLLKKHPQVKNIKVDRMIQVSFAKNFSTEDINQYCFENGIVLNHLQKRKRSLESKFMEMTK